MNIERLATQGRLNVSRMDPGIFDSKVTGVRVDELRFEMRPALELAGRSITTREYVVVQVTLDDGTTGTAYVLTRGQAIGRAVESLAGRLLGKTLTDVFLSDEKARGKLPVQRARAVLDICAWDIAGKLQDAPVWHLMGGVASQLPVLLVAGYRRHGESNQAMARRLVRWRDEGYGAIKIAADIGDARTVGLLSEIRKLAGEDELDLVIDLGFAGKDVAQLKYAAKSWEPFGIKWLEDPMAVEFAAEIKALRAAAPMQIAAGDEASPTELRWLLGCNAVDVLRADSTTVGGLTGLAELIGEADVPVSLHVYREVHRHSALTGRRASPVEAFPIGDDFDFVDRFIEALDWNPSEGKISPPSQPGLGLVYTPENVPNHVTRSTSFGPA